MWRLRDGGRNKECYITVDGFQEMGDVRSTQSLIGFSPFQVLWTAPVAGSGCVEFKATVVEEKDIWAMDVGRLSFKLCEEKGRLMRDSKHHKY